MDVWKVLPAFNFHAIQVKLRSILRHGSVVKRCFTSRACIFSFTELSTNFKTVPMNANFIFPTRNSKQSAHKTKQRNLHTHYYVRRWLNSIFLKVLNPRAQSCSIQNTRSANTTASHSPAISGKSGGQATVTARRAPTTINVLGQYCR